MNTTGSTLKNPPESPVSFATFSDLCWIKLNLNTILGLVKGRKNDYFYLSVSFGMADILCGAARLTVIYQKSLGERGSPVPRASVLLVCLWQVLTERNKSLRTKAAIIHL